MTTDLISIILPVFNGAEFVGEAIQSVVDQNYQNFELVIVNDGSTDNSENIILSYKDSRIKYYSQANQGVSVARNLGISKATGNYLCFLDDDDLITKSGLKSRLEALHRNPNLAFVNGATVQMDVDLKKVIKRQFPSYSGAIGPKLVRLDSGCFINLGTLLIRKDINKVYKFPEGWSHAEDLGFFYSLRNEGLLGFVSEVVYIYRRNDSVMSDLSGLAKGYQNFIQLVSSTSADSKEISYLKKRVKRIMFSSYLSKFRFSNALRSLFVT